MNQYETVRVASEMAAQLIADVSHPVVVVGLQRHDDGTIDLVFQEPAVTDAMLDRAVKAMHDYVADDRDHARHILEAALRRPAIAMEENHGRS